MTQTPPLYGNLYPGTIFRVVVIYDHFDSGCQAKGFVDQFTSRFPEHTHVNLNLWRVDILTLPGVLASVHEELQGAELLVLSFSYDSEVSDSVYSLVESWARANAAKVTSMALFHNFSSVGNRTAARLKELAIRHGVTLFCNFTVDTVSGTLAKEALANVSAADPRSLLTVVNDLPSHFAGEAPHAGSTAPAWLN